MLPEPTMAQGSFTSWHLLSQIMRTVTEPSRSNSARTTSPGAAGKAAWQGAGHDEAAGLEGHAVGRQGVGQPGDRLDRVAERGGAGAGAGQLRRCG